jgi:hypothetical protein
MVMIAPDERGLTQFSAHNPGIGKRTRVNLWALVFRKEVHVIETSIKNKVESRFTCSSDLTTTPHRIDTEQKNNPK